VHSGTYAAAFTVKVGADGGGSQARCVEQGVFPKAAYYGAWYYVPERSQNHALWNLLHFQGGTPAGEHGLWDVSLVNHGDGGPLYPALYDFLTGTPMDSATSIPIGRWFHIEAFVERANDASGQLRLLLDGSMVVELDNLKTDDTRWGQWYVGNLANGLMPPESTVYVDDVTISSAP
jgi:hypothetical protein